MYHYIILFITFQIISIFGFSQSIINQNGYNIFYYQNGQKSSEGNFENGKPEGFWKNYYESGILKSEGNRKYHKLDSIWIFYYKNGLLKEKVNYLNNKKEGFSFLYSEEGFLLNRYLYLNDYIQGVSYAYFSDLNRVQHELPYVKGILEGRGYEFEKDGRIISIVTYKKGVVKSIQNINKYNLHNEKVGLWIIYYEDIENEKIKQLEGRYRKGLKNGYFREYDKNGLQLSTTKYVNGEVIENAEELMNVDLVREFYSDASVKWEKTYLGTKPHGTWKKFDTSGVVLETIIYDVGTIIGKGILDKEGIKQGYWKEFYNNGVLRGEGSYDNGTRIGSWKFFHINKKVEQVGKYRKGGKPHGLWVWYYDNGSVRREETYFNGKEDGEMIEYNILGDILEKGSYIEGFKEGEWEVNTGDYIEIGNYVEDMMHGVWKGIYKSTKKTAFTGEYIEDQPNGKHIYYYPTGRKMLEGKYQLGLKVGDWKRYDEYGVLKLVIKYKNGVAQKIGGKTVIHKSKK